MTDDYKRLCNELLSYLYQCDWPDGERFYALTERVRTALAEPKPEEPPPDIIRVGDIWEFEADVLVKGSRKVKPMMLQWEVVGWHHGELSWQLKCLDEKVLKPEYIYVFTHEPQYTEMTRIKWGGSND